jgi:hypothetical protein
MKKSLLSIGIGLVLVGIGPFIAVEYEEHAHNWTPLDVQVILKPGEFRSPEFKTDLDGRYLLSLATDQLSGPDLKREQCLMGVLLPRTVLNCDEVEKSVEFDWQVLSDKGNTIKMGSYVPLSISSSEITFGEFIGRRNIRQNLILRIQRDAGDLNSHHPRLIVEAGPEIGEALPYLQLFSLLWAGVVGVLGFVIFVLPPIKLGGQSNKNQSAN